MRNLVVVTLEGVSQLQLWQYSFLFRSVFRRYFHKSMDFRHFYSASTSGFQSFCDLMFGDSSELDHNTVYPVGAGCLRGRSSHFFRILKERGYETLAAQRGSPCSKFVLGGGWGAWPEECGPFQAHEDMDDFAASVNAFAASAVADAKPFAMYLSDRSALPRDDNPERRKRPRGWNTSLLMDKVLPDKGFYYRLLEGMDFAKDFVRGVFRTLETLGVLENTVVVVMGSYGVDLWKHGLCGGRTHGVNPYADTCWLPLFIHHNGDAGTFDNMVSMIDLKPSLLHLLFPDEPTPEPASPFAGMNIFRQQRLLAFTQRMFARQLDNQDEYKSMERSYAVTDGEQRLIVFSGGGVKGRGGMELYYDPRDPSNTRNFLDFFNLDENGNMTSFGHPEIVHPHFIMSFKPHLIMSIVESYNTLRPQLFNFVRAKEAAAGATEAELLPEQVFKIKNRRH